MAGRGGKRPAARARLGGGLPWPYARFAHDSNICSTNVTDGTGPRQYILLYTHVVGYPTYLRPLCRPGKAHGAGRRSSLSQGHPLRHATQGVRVQGDDTGKDRPWAS